MTTVTRLRVEGIAGIDDVSRVRSALAASPDVDDVIVELRSAQPARIALMSRRSLDEDALRGTLAGVGAAVAEVQVDGEGEASASAAQSGARQAAHTSAAHRRSQVD